MLKDFFKGKRKVNGMYLGSTGAFSEHTVSKFTNYHCNLSCYGHSSGVCIILENTTANITLNTVLTEKEALLFREILDSQIKNMAIDKKNREIEEQSMLGDC